MQENKSSDGVQQINSIDAKTTHERLQEVLGDFVLLKNTIKQHPEMGFRLIENTISAIQKLNRIFAHCDFEMEKQYKYAMARYYESYSTLSKLQSKYDEKSDDHQTKVGLIAAGKYNFLTIKQSIYITNKALELLNSN
jgi:hypothetical protein